MLSSSSRYRSILIVAAGMFCRAADARAQGAALASLAELQPGHLIRLDARTLDQLGAKVKFTRKNRVSSDAHASLDSETSSIKSVPHFIGTFDSGGQTFRYSMVGRRPSSGQPVSVRNSIVPVRLLLPFADVSGNQIVLDASTKVADTLASPVYQRAPFASGNTQFGDAMQRATFWNQLSPLRDTWHVWLDQPDVRPTLDVLVPPESVLAFALPDGSAVALLSTAFFDAVLALVLQLDDFDARELPIILTYNTLLFDGDPSVCCAAGFHSAFSRGPRGRADAVQTFVFASWIDSGIFANPAMADIHPLSHEIAEWLNDPFVDNLVPPYVNGETGCSQVLETGDQLVGFSVPVTLNGFLYHPQTQSVLPFFTRESPSSAQNGTYRFPEDPAVPNVFSTPCSLSPSPDGPGVVP